MSNFRIKYQQLINLTKPNNDSIKTNETIKRLESNPKFSEVINLLNSNNKEADKSSNSNNGFSKESIFNKPVNIPSLKQNFFSLHNQKKAPTKLYPLQESKLGTDSNELSKQNKEFKQKAKSFSTMSWEYHSDKFNVSDKNDNKAQSNSLSNAKIIEIQSEASEKKHYFKKSFDKIDYDDFLKTRKKAVNLKSTSLIKKRLNKCQEFINVEGEGADVINQYIKDLHPSIQDSDYSSKNKAQSSKLLQNNTSGSTINDCNYGIVKNNFYSINVYLK